MPFANKWSERVHYTGAEHFVSGPWAYLPSNKTAYTPLEIMIIS